MKFEYYHQPPPIREKSRIGGKSVHNLLSSSINAEEFSQILVTLNKKEDLFSNFLLILSANLFI